METLTTETGGLLLVDKPAGITSHDVVAIVRRAVSCRRVGHTGTLDPFATGLLVLLVGRGTRLIPYVDGEPKIYDATIRFGTETDTDDITGVPIREAQVPSDAAIADAVAQLTGAIDQMPPDYSAKKVGGTRAYAAARRGAALELTPVVVNVHRWELYRRAGTDLDVRITCSGGTYIRALARDLGRLTGSAAHLRSLRRVRSGNFTVETAAAIEDVQSGLVTLRPLREAVPSLPTQRVDGEELRRVVHGNSIESRTPGDRVALVDDADALVAIAESVANELQPKLVLRDA